MLRGFFLRTNGLKFGIPYMPNMPRMKTSNFSPRLLTILLAQSLSCLHATRARSQTTHSFIGKQKYLAPQEDRTYNSFIWNQGYLQTGNTLGKFDISFDYTVTPWKSKVFTNYSVHKSYNNLVAPNLTMRDFFGFESGWNNNFINFHFGTTHNQNSAADPSILGVYGSIGYGYNFFCLGRGDHLSDKRLVIKPSLNLLISGFNLNLLSTGDSKEQVNILGFTENASIDSLTEPNVNVKVVFRQRCVALMPQLSITNNPFRNTIHWGINVSYLLPLIDRGYLYLHQDGVTYGDGDADDPRGRAGDTRQVLLSSSDLHATYNEKTVTQSPFNLHGLYFGFSLGVNFN